MQLDGWLGGRRRQILLRSDRRSIRLHIQGWGRFALHRDGGLRLPPAAPPAVVADALCGPLLPLALAWRDIFLLHGAALLTPRGLLLLLGDSGAGKSTLTQHLAGFAGTGIPWADDAVALDPQGRCPGPFPQPKWAGWKTRSHDATPPVLAVVCLKPHGPGETAAAPVLAPLRGAEATLALVRHTVSGRLFGPGWLARHLRWAGQLAAAGPPIFQLRYRRQTANLDRMSELLTNLWRGA
ncbi:MAG: hypothetical protein AAGA23_14380 [Pseudomonadota bacterium]